jgi:hypothetical protein
VFIFIQDNPFAVLILTPILMRAHDLLSAKDQVFVDSTIFCDPENHCITLLLTPFVVGTVPFFFFL